MCVNDFSGHQWLYDWITSLQNNFFNHNTVEASCFFSLEYFTSACMCLISEFFFFFEMLIDRFVCYRWVSDEFGDIWCLIKTNKIKSREFVYSIVGNWLEGILFFFGLFYYAQTKRERILYRFKSSWPVRNYSWSKFAESCVKWLLLIQWKILANKIPIFINFNSKNDLK